MTTNDNDLPTIGEDLDAMRPCDTEPGNEEDTTNYDLMVENYPEVLPLAEALDVALPEFMVSLQRLLSLQQQAMTAIRLRSLEIIKERDELKFRMDGLEK